MTLTLRVRLTALYTAVFGVLFGAFTVVSYQVLARRLDDDATSHLAELAEGLHGFVRIREGEPTVVFNPADVSQSAFIHEATRYYRIYNASTGRLVGESTGFTLLGLRDVPDVQKSRAQPTRFDLLTPQGRFRISTSVGSQGPSGEYLLQVGESLASMDGTLARYRDLLLWRVPVALIAAALATWWMSRFALRPLARVAAAAHVIDITTLGARLPLRGADDELDEVARAFNETLSRLERAVDDMRQFSMALAHELRTPLAALRGEIELDLRRPGLDETRRNTIGSQLEEIDRLKRLIDQILTLARAEAGQIPLRFTAVDLAALSAKLVDDLMPLAEARTIDLRCETRDGVMVQGDAGWLERLVLNLVDNALKFTKTGGRVVVRVVQTGNGASLEVRDSGVGMEPAVTSQIFDRFFRADRSRSSASEGAGLGLSLVKWIVDAHEGRIRVDSRPGEGSIFTVWLPATRAAASGEQSSVMSRINQN
jgi:heavy metal sensor kinase